MEHPAIIECRNLKKSYTADGQTVRAVDNVNLSVARGDFVIILGHSGSGKTTLLSMIGGLTTPDSGEVLVNGIENWHQSDARLTEMRNQTIGFIFQFASLIPTLTALENILLPLSFGNRKAATRREARDILAQVGLKDRENAFPAQLSGGQQRRIAIARAFINEPAIILADEPTGDLDEDTEQEILSVFHEYHRQGTTFIVVTHNVHLAESQENPRILHMRKGVLSERNPARSQAA